MKRRLTAIIAGTLLAAVWAAPAFAMSNTRFLSPGSEAVRGNVLVRVASTPDAGLVSRENISVTVTITPPAGAGGPFNLSLSPKGEDTFEATWNTGSLPLNGTYSLEAVATSSSLLGDKSERATASARVSNPPATPTGVKAALKDGVPHITWAANSEKDLAGYKVLRSVGGGTPVQAASGPATSFTDSSAPHSKPLTYKVVAVRKSPGGSVDSGPSAASRAVTVPAPPPEAAPEGEAPAEGAPAEGAPADPDKPLVPGTNVVTGKETPKAPAPATNRNFGKAIAPIVKSAPGGTAFDETLPYSGVPPEQFEAASDSDPSLMEEVQSGFGDAVTVTNPVRFIVGGILLLIASGFMWRASRKLLKGTRIPEGAPPSVNYPAFRINRG